LSGAGKSTIANVLLIKTPGNWGAGRLHFLTVIWFENICLPSLVFPANIAISTSDALGTSPSEITKNRGIAICAPIAPYDAMRKEVRSMIAPLGGFIMVHLSTPVEVCEERDRKGLYAKARAALSRSLPAFPIPTKNRLMRTSPSIRLNSLPTRRPRRLSFIWKAKASSGIRVTRASVEEFERERLLLQVVLST